jgi:Flp pilus assembly protein TadG
LRKDVAACSRCFHGWWSFPLRGLASLRAFCADRRGNIAILFGLLLVPVVGAMGVALDYSFANQGRTQMQAALDLTGLALSKMMPLTQADLDTRGRKIFLANLGGSPLTIKEANVAEQLTITPDTGKLTLRVETEYPIKMAGVLSKLMPPDIPVAATTEVVWGQGKVEVALALDNTGSMAGSKLTQLISASHNLIEILRNASRNPGDATIAVVPFGVEVKADPAAYVDASWLRWDLWEENHGTCNIAGRTTRTNCGSCSVSGNNTPGSCGSAGTCSRGNSNTQSSCERNGYRWTPATWSPGTWTPSTDHSSWKGCIQDRDKDPSLDYDVNDTGVSDGDIATKFPAVEGISGDCGNLATVMPLNHNWGDSNSIDPATLHGKINSMIATGNTNVTIGLHWALQMIAPTDTLPLSQGAAYDTEKLTKYIVILTDGDNTQNRWVKNSASPIDARTAAACAAIKARDIKVYSIRLISGNATLLRNCATEPGMYFEVSDASQLQSVFNTIGTTIANLHLAR